MTEQHSFEGEWYKKILSSNPFGKLKRISTHHFPCLLPVSLPPKAQHHFHSLSRVPQKAKEKNEANGQERTGNYKIDGI